MLLKSDFGSGYGCIWLWNEYVANIIIFRFRFCFHIQNDWNISPSTDNSGNRISGPRARSNRIEFSRTGNNYRDVYENDAREISRIINTAGSIIRVFASSKRTATRGFFFFLRYYRFAFTYSGNWIYVFFPSPPSFLCHCYGNLRPERVFIRISYTTIITTFKRTIINLWVTNVTRDSQSFINGVIHGGAVRPRDRRKPVEKWMWNAFRANCTFTLYDMFELRLPELLIRLRDKNANVIQIEFYCVLFPFLDIVIKIRRQQITNKHRSTNNRGYTDES